MTMLLGMRKKMKVSMTPLTLIPLKLASDDSIVEGKCVEENVSKEDDLEETPIVTAKNNLLDQVPF